MVELYQITIGEMQLVSKYLIRSYWSRLEISDLWIYLVNLFLWYTEPKKSGSSKQSQKSVFYPEQKMHAGTAI